MFTLLFTTTATQLIVTGKTFPIKELLKALGGRWEQGRWVLPLNADSPLTRARLVENCRLGLLAEKEAKEAEKAAQMARTAYLHTPEFVKEALAAKAAGNCNFHWICCDQCVILNFSRQHTSCQACGHDNGMWKETFFVRGLLRTGD